MQTFRETRDFWGTSAAVFQVPTTERGDVFMRISRTNYGNNERAVVEVDGDKFLSLWRSEPYSIHADIAHGTPLTWEKDYKFHHAEDGFSRGPENPVPLATVTCEVHKEKLPIWEKHFFFFKKKVGYRELETPYVAFSNGITRTIWLMTFGAKIFPVECSSIREAELLQTYAGVVGGHIKTIDSLVPN
jgi:hypothetical protein